MVAVAGCTSDGAGIAAVSGDSTFTPSQGVEVLSGEAYGAGIAIDTKNNFRIGVDTPKLSHRFRASTSSELLSVSWQRRTGPGYSAGDGGILRISVQSDDGSGRPSGEVLASLRYDTPDPGPIGILAKNTFPSPARLTAGRLYHIVFENVHADPQGNHVSVNDVLTWNPTTPRQPSVSQDYAVLTSSNGWSVSAMNTANMDLVYADGTHDGVAYIGILGEPLRPHRRPATGPRALHRLGR